jgi:hypothetical protein
MLQQQNDKIKAARRETVMASYSAARAENNQRFLEGDTKATSEYIYDNQKEDAAGIVNEYYFNNRRVVSATKKTKVGADGLMIEVAKLMTTHPDDNFVINPANVRILTGMSNASWEKDMKEKAPGCFRGKIFHHGQLKNADLRSMRDSLIIVDELDTGDKECQVLHNVLKAAGVLDITYMEQNNIRFMFISATMMKELYELYRWGEFHCLYAMTIPASYIGHTDFLARGIIQEFYPVTTAATASKWIQEDILNNYGSEDCRIHIIRSNLKYSGIIQNECIKRGIPCFNHTSDDKIEEEVLRQLFEGPALTRHVVLIVKGFFRRANLIPNNWKLRIGATHEFHTKKVDNNVQIQALPGRMSGYWRDDIEAGHKTGPYRTSVQAIREYEEVYNNPFGRNTYQTAGFKKKNGKVTLSTSVFVSPQHIENLVPGKKATCSNVMSNFYACEPENKLAVLRQIEEENRDAITTHKFSGSNLFKEDKRDADGKWMGFRREWAVFTYEQLETEEWGLGEKEKARVTVCYQDGQVGLILRYMKAESDMKTDSDI